MNHFGHFGQFVCFGRVAALAALLGLAGCAGSQFGSLSSLQTLDPIALTASQKAAVEDGLRAVLKDPESARFGSYAAGVSADGVITVCGSVNAKNSFGGYTGKKPYMGILAGKPPSERFAAISVGGNEIKTSVTIKACFQQGLHPADW